MPQEINPNTPVEREEVVEAKANEAIDFEEVEAIEEASKEERKEAAKKVVDEKPEEPEPKPAEEPEPSKEAEGEKPAEADPAKHQNETKLIKIKAGENEHELPEDAKVPTKIDGQLQEVTLSELKSNYSGKVVYEKKFNELDKDKKSFTRQVDFVNNKVNEIREMAQEDPMMAFFELCRMNNTTPEEQAKAWEKFSEEAGEWSQLTDEEKEAKLAIKERDYYKKTMNADKDRQARAQKKAQLDAQAETARKQYGISEAEYQQAEQVAEKLYPDGTAIGPREVITTHRINVVERVLQDAAPDQVFEGSEAFPHLLNVAMSNPDFDPSDIKEIAEATYGNKTGRNLGRKVSKTGTQPAQPRTPDSNDSLLSFEQL